MGQKPTAASGQLLPDPTSQIILKSPNERPRRMEAATLQASGIYAKIRFRMPAEARTISAAAQDAAQARRANLIAIATWLVPGLGYFLLRRRVRGALVAVAVAGMFIFGLMLQGQLYQWSQLGDLLSYLGWIGDLCSGSLYFITRLMGGGAGNAFTVWGNYGTTYLISSGLMNILAAADVRDIALGRKA